VRPAPMAYPRMCNGTHPWGAGGAPDSLGNEKRASNGIPTQELPGSRDRLVSLFRCSGDRAATPSAYLCSSRELANVGNDLVFSSFQFLTPQSMTAALRDSARHAFLRFNQMAGDRQIPHSEWLTYSAAAERLGLTPTAVALRAGRWPTRKRSDTGEVEIEVPGYLLTPWAGTDDSLRSRVAHAVSGARAPSSVGSPGRIAKIGAALRHKWWPQGR